MKKRFNLTGSIIAGAAALFVGLAAKVQANPISMPDESDTRMHSWIWRHDQSNYETAHSFDQNNGNQNLASPAAIFLFRSVPAQNAGKPSNFGSWNSYRHRHGGSKKTPSLPAQAGSPANVPDGGTTAMMFGGVFCGLALLAKNLKA